MNVKLFLSNQWKDVVTVVSTSPITSGILMLSGMLLLFILQAIF